VPYGIICYLWVVTATWTWDRHVETWASPNYQTGGESVLSKPFLPGVSLQRAIVRFSPYATFGTDRVGKYLLPADLVLTVTLELSVPGQAVVNYAFESIAPEWLYLRLSDTDLNTWQQYYGRLPSIEWDVVARHKNVGPPGQEALLTLRINHTLFGSNFGAQLQPAILFGALQFDALFTV